MSDQPNGWTIPEDTFGYLRHEQKRLDNQNRRPAALVAMDLVGPGIAKSATRVTNLNDPIALNNGFFSAAAGAEGAPAAGIDYVFVTISDAELGGVQIIWPVSTASLQTFWRKFTRNPLDPTYITFSAWAGH